jgi:hypothetical protein
MNATEAVSVVVPADPNSNPCAAVRTAATTGGTEMPTTVLTTATTAMTFTWDGKGASYSPWRKRMRRAGGGTIIGGWTVGLGGESESLEFL